VERAAGSGKWAASSGDGGGRSAHDRVWSVELRVEGLEGGRCEPRWYRALCVGGGAGTIVHTGLTRGGQTAAAVCARAYIPLYTRALIYTTKMGASALPTMLALPTTKITKSQSQSFSRGSTPTHQHTNTPTHQHTNTPALRRTQAPLQRQSGIQRRSRIWVHTFQGVGCRV